jgi:hypothetical protein
MPQDLYCGFLVVMYSELNDRKGMNMRMKMKTKTKIEQEHGH